MKPENNAARHFLKVRLKLLLLIASVPVSHAGFTLLLNRYFFRLNKLIPVAVSAIPYASFMIYLLRNTGKNSEKAAHCRYSPFCSFVFKHQNKPFKSENVDIHKIKNSLKPGDIVLRRNTNYLVELIFTQNSYFTHVGICVSNDGTRVKIMDCTSEHGINFNDAEDFCSCNSVAILRFSVNDNALKDISNKTKYAGWEKEAVWKYGTHDEASRKYPGLQHVEQKIHDAIISELGMGKSSPDSLQKILEDNNHQQTILKRARSLKGAPFDYHFDFERFDRFSCIEYVWYCFKCLYPLHRIKVSDFEYFEFITVPVIMPDVFINNPFFKYVHSSVPGVYNKPQLQKHIRTKQRQVTKFVINIAVWDVIILCVLKILLKPRSKRR